MNLKKLILLPLILLSTAVLASCGGDSGKKDFIDYAHNGEVKLALDYHERDFYKDGIVEVTLRTCIDGDTAHFVPKTGTDKTLIKSRFYGIDTPESTGSVQPYGRTASKFTKEKLLNAAANGTIVVSTPAQTYQAPMPDTTGQRYVSLIWINETKQNASLDELVLINLWIVQEGLSWIKGLDYCPQYQDTFIKAENQAKEFKLKLHSGEPDPDFNYGGYVDVTLLELKREIQKEIAEPDYVNKYDNSNVRVQGTVAGYANNIIYLQNYFSEEEVLRITGETVKGGEYAGINIFAGMALPQNDEFTIKNTYVEVCGNAASSENFGFQISGCKFPIVPYSDSDSRVLLSAEENIEDPTTGQGHKLHVFDYNVAALEEAAKKYDCAALYSPVTLSESVKVISAYVSDDKNTTLTLADSSNNKLTFKIYVAFQYRPDPTKYIYYTKAEDWIGHSFLVNECVYSTHKGTSSSTGEHYYSMQIAPGKSENLIQTA